MAGFRKSGGSNVALTIRKRRSGGSWVDLTIAKRREGGVWVDLFHTASISPNPASNSGVSSGGSPINVSRAATCSASGGTVQSYAWTRTGGTGTPNLSSTTAATVTFSTGLGTTEVHINCTYQCLVTFVGGATATASVNVILDRFNDS